MIMVRWRFAVYLGDFKSVEYEVTAGCQSTGSIWEPLLDYDSAFSECHWNLQSMKWTMIRRNRHDITP